MTRTLNNKLPYPKRDSDVKSFLSAVSKHKDTYEYRIRITGLLAEVRARGGKSVTQWSSLRHGSISHLGQRRRKLHDEIVDHLLLDTSRCRGKNPIAIILLGPPGAGKTTIGAPLARSQHQVTFTTVNPDDVKEKLPEYEGWNASALHEESSYVSEMMTKTHVVNSRHHMIYDITGKRSDKIAGAITELDTYGYRVYLVLIDLAPWHAVCRVWERFQKNPFGRLSSEPGSRYVEPHYVYYEVGDRPRKTYNILKTYKGVTGYCRVDALKSKPGNAVILDRKDW